MSLLHLKEELIFLAKSAESAERYEEMKDFMKEFTEKTDDMSIDERNLLNVAYKNQINPKISSLRILKSLKETQFSLQKPHLIEIYMKKIEYEINSLCVEKNSQILENFFR